jgi:hypothetical protein
MARATVNQSHALMFNLQQTMKEIGATYYLEEYWNDKHIVLWTFTLQILIWDLISHINTREGFVSSRNGKEKEVSSGLFGPKKKLYSVCELN